MITTHKQSNEKQPGNPRQETNRTAEVKEAHHKKGSVMTKNTPTHPSFTSAGYTTEQLLALAKGLAISVEDNQGLDDDLWAEFDRRGRRIRLSGSLGPKLYRCILAEMIARAHISDIDRSSGSKLKQARELAAQMLITTSDWAIIGPAWEACKANDPWQIFREHGVEPSLVGAYAEWVASDMRWHPEGFIDWFGLCGLPDPDDDIHPFNPVPMQIMDGSVVVTKSATGTPYGDEPLEIGLEIDVYGAIMHDNSTTFHVTPQQARELAGFLQEQADAIEAWGEANSHLFNEDSKTLPKPQGEKALALAGGGA